MSVLENYKITCIDLTKLKEEDLLKVELQLKSNGLETLLKFYKQEGYEKVWLDVSDCIWIAAWSKKTMKMGESYKGLITNSDLHLSKKEKDALIKIKPAVFNLENIEMPVLEVDVILDKISKYGVDAMSSAEKKFLDEGNFYIMKSLKERNITLIDLKNYNDAQLTRISAIVGLVDGSLQDSKKDGVEKLWFDFDSKMFIAMFDKRIYDSYKGLATNSKLKLSKKEKDYLLKMKPTEFDTRKRKAQQQNVAEENGEKDFSDKMDAFINPVNNETQNQNIPLKDRNITLIDLKKYNDVQLTRISAIVGLVDGSLQWEKRRGSSKIWFDFNSKTWIAVLDKEIIGSYQGLVTNSDLELTKKEKDYLLKMKPTEFDTRKRKKQQQNVAETVEHKDEKRVQNNELPIVLELDAILDKITEFGIDSLSDEERKYLEDTSKK